MPALTDKQRNRIALLSLLAAKLVGISGLVLAYTGRRAAAGVLLTFAFFFIAFAVGVCISVLRGARKERASNVATLEAMIRDGTLAEHVRAAEANVKRERNRMDERTDEKLEPEESPAS